MQGRIGMNITDIRAMIRGSYHSAEKNKSKNNQKSGTITIRRSFNASRTLAQLANAKTKSQVSAVERAVRAQMQSMKKQSGSEDAVRQMKYVIQKANTKRMALTREERLDNNRKVAKSADNKKQEAALTSELRRKRTNRMRREVVDALNAPDVFRKDKYDTYTIGKQEQANETTTTIDIACDVFEVSTKVNESVGGAIDALL
jgi:hypothetical protein